MMQHFFFRNDAPSFTMVILLPYLYLCKNPSYMMNQGSTDSQCIWNVALHGLPWHMLCVCSCLSTHSFHIPGSVTKEKAYQLLDFLWDFYVPGSIIKKHEMIKVWLVSLILTLLGASLGSSGKPLTELESIERKIFTLKSWVSSA